MGVQTFAVDVAAEESVVRTRLNEVAQNPDEVVQWFTSGPDVVATVTPSGDVWLVDVEANTFKAKGSVVLRSRVPGSTLTVSLDLRGKGLLALAGPMLGALGGRIESSVRSTLYRDFGAP